MSITCYCSSSLTQSIIAFLLLCLSLGFVYILADEIPSISTSDASSMLDSPKSPDDINKDRYHMLSGICVEALCSQLITYSDEDFCYFLMSINALLETELGRERLTQEKVNTQIIFCFVMA